nr:putative reverse transcriptase, RNA-dependent DNA polymerase [Tanacetum cinerariifolium]
RSGEEGGYWYGGKIGEWNSTERDGLYYVDEVVQSGTVMLAHGTTEREAWLWHRRLGHLSYVLPPRSNIGVPPKRYSPEKTTRGSKYLMANIAEGNLSNSAKAFAASLCSEEIPSSIEHALKSKNWKNAMDDEMKPLKKNETWDQCALPQGKQAV